ncbi:MAG: hypothetical protein HY716_03595 [Planctomycetes bacterium]|nr:hypothetical protein [Planctomycetota bacterium]
MLAMVGQSTKPPWWALAGMAFVLASCRSTEEAPLRAGNFIKDLKSLSPETASAAASDENLHRWRDLQKRRKKTEEERLARQPKVSMTLNNAPIREALLQIAQQAGVNIVMDQTLAGHVTLKLHDAPLETAIRLVAFAGNTTYSTDGCNYYVGTLDPTAPNFSMYSTTRVIPTYQPPKQVVARLNKAYANYLAYAEGTNLLTLTGPTAVLDRLEADIWQVDQAPIMVLIEVLIAEVKTGDGIDVGLDYSQIQAAIEQKKKSDNDRSTFNLNQLDVMGRLALAFDILESRNIATIRSRPHIVTANGTPAEIRSLVESYVHVFIQPPGLPVLSSGLQIIKSGTTLHVTPTVTRNGEIELVLEPELADVVGITPANIGSLPVINRRGAKSVVRVKDGGVAIIGGLYEENSRRINRGLPFLKDVPVVNIFTSKQEHHYATTELLIYVSPKILR